jgi:hypothetical protein
VGERPPHVADDEAEENYHRVLERWTRRAEIYDRLDLKLFIAATEESVDFRTAKAERLASFQGIPKDGVKALIDRELGASQQSYDFYLGVHTTSPTWNDFDRTESIWRMALKSDEGEVTPIQVERLGRPDINTRGIYLYVGDFWTGYRLHFPVTFADGRPLLAPGERTVTLRIYSAVGHTELVFEAAPVSALGPPKISTAPTR